jgi:PAS domain S-box-containing protein
MERSDPGASDAVQAYLDFLPLVVMEIAPDGTVRRLNRAGSELLGWSADELLGRDWFDALIPEASREAARREFQAWLAGDPEASSSGQSSWAHREGGCRTMAWRRSRVGEPGDVQGVSLAAEDITERRRTSEELEGMRARLDDIQFALNAASIVAITDAHGVITYANDKFCEISKYAREELVGRTHKLINSKAHPKKFWKDLWDTIERGEVWQGDIRNQAKDGSYYWVATTIVPFVDADGKPYQYLALRNEITQRKEAEEELRQAYEKIRQEQAKLVQAEKLSSIGLLAAGVAHEVNNPLAGVKACVKALRQDRLPEDRREEYFQAVADGLDRIERIVKGLLDFARPQSSGWTDLDLGQLVRACLLLLAPTLRKSEVSVETSFDDEEVLVRGDRSQLMQAILNVLLNAVQACPAGSAVQVSVLHEDDWIGLAFQDEGPGIPEGELARVCDPFFTTKPEGEGTGLGLAVTLGIIEAHEGRLDIESASGEGTRVIFWLKPGGDGPDVAQGGRQ